MTQIVNKKLGYFLDRNESKDRDIDKYKNKDQKNVEII